MKGPEPQLWQQLIYPRKGDTSDQTPMIFHLHLLQGLKIHSLESMEGAVCRERGLNFEEEEEEKIQKLFGYLLSWLHVNMNMKKDIQEKGL